MNFINYNQEVIKHLPASKDTRVSSFVTTEDTNLDQDTIDSFGEEWLKFNTFTPDEINIAGSQYFDVVNEQILNKEAIVLDLGCGSGRWTKYIAKKVKLVEAVDPSSAIFSAVKLNEDEANVRVTQASVSNIPFNDETFDLIVCLGVLHHIPDTQQALTDVVKKLKKGGSILLYLYYSLENRGFLYQFLFNISTIFRLTISKLPKPLKKITCDFLALSIYFPLVLLTRSLYGIFGQKKWIHKVPLSYYSNKTFKIMRNDALDRFGTPLEQRFSKEDITKLMKNAELSNIEFSNNEPYWHMLGTK